MHIHCKYDELIAPKKLKNHPKNRNKHGQDQIERLANMYAYHGIRHPIIVSSRSNCIVAGHGRKLAAIRAGIKEFPVVFQTFDNDNAEYAFLQSDNAIALWADLDLDKINEDILDLESDFNIDMLGIKNLTLDNNEKEALTDEDEVPEKVEAKSKLGDIYQLGEHRLMCGDSTSMAQVTELMDGEKADMVFTDPPYGIDIVQGSSVGRSKPFGSGGGGGKLCKVGKYSPIIGDSTTKTAIDSYNLCAGLGIETLIFWGGNYYASSLPDSSCWIVWDKESTGNFADAELAWTNKKTAVRIFKHMWNGMLKASEHGSKRVHPTQKPIALAEWAFKEYGKNEDKVLDLFGGSGSTLIACEKTNRKCFMMELDPHYCDVVVARWEKYTGKQAELISGKT